MPAVTIDDVITLAPTDIADLSYGGVKSLYTQMGLWIAGMFASTTAIFPASANDGQYPNQRVVTDWYAQHELALVSIEGQGVGQSGVIGTSEVINAVVRVAYAVKNAQAAALISGAQVAAVITLYNATWE